MFIAFEYDFSRQQQQRQPALPVTADSRRQPARGQTQRRNETLFDVEAADIEAESTRAGGAGAVTGIRTGKKGTLPLPVLQGTQRKKGQRDMPLLNSPFLEEEEGFDGIAATPTPRFTGGVDNKRQVGAAGAKPKPQAAIEVQRKEEQPREEDLEEDLDPFRRSLVDDEEAQVRTVVKVRTGPTGVGRAGTPTGLGGMRTPTSAGGFGTIAKPSLVNFGTSPAGVGGGGGLGFGHRKTGSSGSAPGAAVNVGGIQLQQKQQQQHKMLTSTQELNMKSQFLMNMRAYGEESEAVLEEQGQHDSQLEEMEIGGSGKESAARSWRKEKEDSLSEGEESQLGPGSDFFK